MSHHYQRTMPPIASLLTSCRSHSSFSSLNPNNWAGGKVPTSNSTVILPGWMNNFTNGECTQQQCLPGGRVGIVPAANVSVEVLLQVASLVLPVNGSARIISLVGMNDSRIDGTHNIRRRNLITTCQACCSSAAQSRSCFRKLQIQSTLHGPIGPLRGRSSTAP